MDGLTLQAKVYGGYAKSAARIGLPFDVYRPTSAVSPLSAPKINTLPAAFTVHSGSNFSFSRPSDYKGPLFHALVDASQLQVGDYLNNPSNTFGPFFIAALNPIVPPLAVSCNRVLTVWQPGPSHALGPSYSSGSVATDSANSSAGTANETAILTNWPASILLGARGRRDQELPGDAGVGVWQALMPAFAGVVIRAGSIITDDLGNRFVVQGAELQDLGWRINALQAVT